LSAPKSIALPPAPPQPVEQEVTVKRGGSVDIPLRIYGTRAQTLSWLIRRPPAHGKLSNLRATAPETALITYTPPADLRFKTDRFTFSARSNEGASAPAEVLITIADEDPRLLVPAMLDFGALLSDDAVVCVKGRVDLREEPAKIVCMELKRPDLSPENSRPVRIKLDTSALTSSCLARLKEVLREHPGDQPVLVHLDSTILRLPDEFRVHAGNGLVAELRELLGANGLVG